MGDLGSNPEINTVEFQFLNNIKETLPDSNIWYYNNNKKLEQKVAGIRRVQCHK